MAEHYWPGQMITSLPFEETVDTIFIDTLPAVPGHELEHGWDLNWPAGMTRFGKNNVLWSILGEGQPVSFHAQSTIPPNANTDVGLYLILQTPGYIPPAPIEKPWTYDLDYMGPQYFQTADRVVAGGRAVKNYDGGSANRVAGFTVTLQAGVTYHLTASSVSSRAYPEPTVSHADQILTVKVWTPTLFNDLRANAETIVIPPGGTYQSPAVLNSSLNPTRLQGDEGTPVDGIEESEIPLYGMHNAWWKYQTVNGCQYTAVGLQEPLANVPGLDRAILKSYVGSSPDALTLQEESAVGANPATINGVATAGQTVWFLMAVTNTPNRESTAGHIYSLQVTATENEPTEPPPVVLLPPPLLLPFLPPFTPTHHIGVGPATDTPVWRGAPNHGVNRADTPWTARPTLRMPEAQSSSFTLRLVGGSEARTDHEVPRDQAIVVQEMATDVWWRRRDPTRHTIDGIGRFNADTVDINLTDTGVRMSVSWVDYQGLLEDRLVLKYLDTVNAESMWDTGTPVTDILRFAIPTNAGLDLANIEEETAFDLGVTDEPFELPTGTTIADVMSNLLDVSVTPWEWWVNMPGVDTRRPKLMFVQGTRGQNRNITLFDLGTGQGPIQSWSMQASADRYANALFYNGSEGGVVVDLPTEIATYGQRDASDSDASLKGNITAIIRAATKKLQKLADQTPTWTLTLVNGFWEGRQHIDIGDWVTVHIALGAEVLSGLHRVTELQCDVDSSGTETVTLTVGPPRPSRDTRSRRSVLARLVRTLKRYERKGS